MQSRILLVSSALALIFATVSAQGTGSPDLADSVRAEFLHAWNGYRQYAWGHDALRPLTKEPHDWYGQSLCMTPVDAYDALKIMGLTKEAAEAKKLIIDSLSFDKDIEVQSFEVTIRLLGGLLSSYELDGDRRFLLLAEDLGRRLLPVFNSATGMPYRYVNLRTQKIRDSLNNPAEIGTALLEFGVLSQLSGNAVFFEKPKHAVVELFKRRSAIGLVGSVINVETGKWVDTISHIGGGIDSYYEYLLKASKLFNDVECKKMWETHIQAINRYLADTSTGSLWYGEAGMNSGRRTMARFGALQAFFPAVLALSGDLPRATRLEASCFRMWNLFHIEPEEIDYTSMKVISGEYYLRPEIIESAYYLHHYTGDTAYINMGRTFFHDLKQYCRTDDAYAMLSDVRTKEKANSMESFFFAETLKYLYLLFAPPGTLDFDSVIFTTEAHPMRRISN